MLTRVRAWVLRHEIHRLQEAYDEATKHSWSTPVAQEIAVHLAARKAKLDQLMLNEKSPDGGRD